MSKFYLPVTINKRRSHICHFIPENSKEDCHFFEFIVHNGGNECELININPDTSFVSELGRKYDIHINNTSTDKQVQQAQDQTKIELTLKKGENTLPNTSIHGEDGLSIRKEKSGNLRTIIYKNFEKDKIKLELKLHVENNNKLEVYFYKCIFHVVNTDTGNNSPNLIEAGIDFGSDSSQMAYRNVSDNARTFPAINIIEELKRFYDSKENVEDYYQHEENEQDIPLFKSFFTVYTKKIQDLRIYLKPNANEDKTFINALLARDTTYLKDKGLKLLPNLKYLQIKTGVFHDDTTVDHLDAYDSDKKYWKTPDQNAVASRKKDLSTYAVHFKRFFLNYFLHVLFRKISDNYIKPYLKIKLLVPNVYNQGKIYDLKRNIYKDYYAMMKEYYEDYTIKGIEVETISESDAAFLGLLNKNDLIDDENKIRLSKNKLFLLVDGGKGTLDFTIVQSGDSENKYNSIYRGGIPGSGQVLNYAIMQIFNDGLSPYGINLQDMIDEADSVQKNEFLKAIENVKKNCVFTNETKRNLFSSIQNDNIISGSGGITSKLDGRNIYAISELIDIFAKNKLTIPDLNGRLSTAVKTLTEAIQKEVQSFRDLHYSNSDGSKLFHQIILSGRAFRFKALEMDIKDKLKDFSDNIVYPKTLAKKGCLEGVMSSSKYKINLNSLMIGFPNLMIIEDTEHGQLKKIVNDKVIKNVDRSQSKVAGDKGLVDVLIDFIEMIISLFGKDKKKKVVTNKKRNDSIDESLILHGLHINTKLYKNLKLSLPGEIYNLDMLYDEEEANLFFTEKEFICRSKSESIPLGEPTYPEHSDNLMNYSNYPIINANVKLSKDLTNNAINLIKLTLDERIKMDSVVEMSGEGSAGYSNKSDSSQDYKSNGNIGNNTDSNGNKRNDGNDIDSKDSSNEDEMY